jgi:hypothetical protein
MPGWFCLSKLSCSLQPAAELQHKSHKNQLHRQSFTKVVWGVGPLGGCWVGDCGPGSGGVVGVGFVAVAIVARRRIRIIDRIRKHRPHHQSTSAVPCVWARLWGHRDSSACAQCCYTSHHTTCVKQIVLEMPVLGAHWRWAWCTMQLSLQLQYHKAL